MVSMLDRILLSLDRICMILDRMLLMLDQILMIWGWLLMIWERTFLILNMIAVGGSLWFGYDLGLHRILVMLERVVMILNKI